MECYGRLYQVIAKGVFRIAEMRLLGLAVLFLNINNYGTHPLSWAKLLMIDKSKSPSVSKNAGIAKAIKPSLKIDPNDPFSQTPHKKSDE